MATRSKRYNSAVQKQKQKEPLAVERAVEVLSEFDAAKFDETVELVLQLGIDPKQSTQNVRGSFSLPHGIGRSVRVIAFAEGEAAEAASEAGALEVGTEDLAKKIQDGWLDFEVAVAHPKTMRFVGRLGKILGPQGKMPSPKSGTVTENVAGAVREFRAGKVEFRNDKGGNLHIPVGKRSFAPERLSGNINAVLEHVRSIRPKGVKGKFIRSAHISSTMSPAVKLAV